MNSSTRLLVTHRAAFGPYERGEAAWNRAPAARGVFRAEGRWNDRVWAPAQIGAALPGLSGREGFQVRGLLQGATALTFLDRWQRQWEAAVPAAELREEWVHLWWLRRPRPRPGAVEAAVGAGPVAHLVQRGVCPKRDANGSGSYRAVARVLRPAVRARSAGECMNRVLRMHQGRHRSLTQGLRDLKRLYGNCRAFRSGKRRGRCPDQHLGLDLPSSDFWSLLRDEMSTVLDEEKVKAKGRSQAQPKARAA